MKNTHAYYLEDMELCRRIAEYNAKKLGVPLATFDNSKSFLVAIEQAEADALLLFDSDIGEEKRGEHVAKIAYERGHRNIYMITAHEKKDFKDMPWIKDVGGKNDLPRFLELYKQGLI